MSSGDACLYIAPSWVRVACLLVCISSDKHLHTLPIDDKKDREEEKSRVRVLAKYLWPQDNSNIKARVVISVSALLASKICTVQVPFYFKDIVGKEIIYICNVHI
jgi:hypothetical protein